MTVFRIQFFLSVLLEHCVRPLFHCLPKYFSADLRVRALNGSREHHTKKSPTSQRSREERRRTKSNRNEDEANQRQKWYEQRVWRECDLSQVFNMHTQTPQNNTTVSCSISCEWSALEMVRTHIQSPTPGFGLQSRLPLCFRADWQDYSRTGFQLKLNAAEADAIVGRFLLVLYVTIGRHLFRMRSGQICLALCNSLLDDRNIAYLWLSLGSRFSVF